MIDDELVFAHRTRALDPDRPVRAWRRAEPRRLLSGARDREPLLYGGPVDRPGRDGSIRSA